MAKTREPSSADSAAIGTEVELDVTNVAHGGVFVARHEGRVIFVADAIPGERVRARITDTGHASFWRADTLDVLSASPHRQEHIWPAAAVDRSPEDRAGGAEFGHIALAHQRELKRQVVVDSLSRMARLDRDVSVEALPGDDESGGTGWRTRVSLHVAEDGTIGPYAARSHRVIPVDHLPLATRRVNETAPFAQKFPNVESVDIVEPSEGPLRLLLMDGRAQKRDTITERVHDRSFALEAGGFWQVHRAAAETLYDAVQGAVDEASFDPRAANLDLYGGVGLMAAALGDRFGSTTRITSVESDEVATDYAGDNLAEWLGAAAVTARVDRYLQEMARNASAAEKRRYAAATVVLDPPRSGAKKPVVNALTALSPAQIVYVACDPVAFARDVSLFAERGYALRSLRAFDLFPNTHHVEAVGLLMRE
ncbi:class I SAM-dependent RNA methyltransferase [Planctomonas psychrotolerans]|uniref:class I SAM-dependent RNA methyltransferase n=1 Tax=Planctomonas psychrotolerans TaxID=2528712 RepID=UPI00123A6421|nr:TRAM domain-containing protein [Planctomonas psychrotolerans]